MGKVRWASPLMQESIPAAKAVPDKHRSSKGLWFLLLLVIGIVLFAGLQPYASYKDNWVSFTPQTNETEFGNYGLVIGMLPPFVEEAAKNNNLQVSITPIISKPSDTSFHVFAQIDSPSSEVPLIFGQWNTSLIAINGHDRRGEAELSRISANLSRHVGIPTEVMYTFGATATKVELDGRFEADGPAFDFSDPLTRISIGNSPDGKFGWYGGVANVKFIDSSDPSKTISYRFDKDTLPAIEVDTTITSDESLNLTAPALGGFPDKAWISSLKFEQLLDNNLMDIIVNFLGFAPLGFLLTALLRTGAKRTHWLLSIIVTVLLGLLLSFGIESIQTMIPGRSPHVHDLFLNTTGALLGSIGFLILAGIWALIKRPKPTSENDSTQSAELQSAEKSNHIDL